MAQEPASEPAPEEVEEVEYDISAGTYESDPETKPKRKASRKPPKSPKSPYTFSTCLYPKKSSFLRSFKGAEGRRLEGPSVKASRQLRRGFLRQDAWVGQEKSELDIGLARSASSDSTPEYLKEALGMTKPKHARFASSGYIPGTPNYKEKEEMYDEIIQLKKEIQTQKCEGDRMKTKLRRLEEENNRKDKQLEQVLDPFQSSEVFGPRTDLKNDSSWVINRLKQKLLKLEQQCKEKDNTINKLQRDIRTTSAEEMRISLETCYEEIQRLQALLVRAKSTERKSPPENKQQKMLNAAIVQLSRSVRELQDENRNLKADLQQVLRCSPAASKTKNYREWSRQRLVRQISKLEKEIAELGTTKPQHSDASSLPSPTPAHLEQPTAKESDPPGECKQVCRLVKKLQGQQVALWNQLVAKEEEIKKLTDKVNTLEAKQGAARGLAEPHSAGPPVQVQSTLWGFLEQFPYNMETAAYRGLCPELTTSGRRSHAASALRSRGSGSRHAPPSSPTHRRKEEAARIIQRWWKASKTKMEEMALDKVAVVLQAAFRGHLARQKLLAISTQGRHSPSTENENSGLSCGPLSSQAAMGDEADEEALTLVQSAFRAHTARTQFWERPPTSSPASEKVHPAVDPGESNPVWSMFKYSPLVFTMQNLATSSSPSPRQPSPLLSADEAHSDDSDDIITVSPWPGKEAAF